MLMLFTLILPLWLTLMAVHQPSRPWLIKTLPWAALPALILALLGNEGVLLSLPYGLAGALLGLDDLRRLFLFLAALLWLAAGGHAMSYLKDDPKQWRFAVFWLLTLTGNLGLILSFDVLSFYSFFALMTFAGYGLVVHTGSVDAYRAGRIYLIMAVIGEGLLLAGVLSAVFVAGVNPALNGLPASIAEAEQVVLITVLILLGFGVKAGLPLLHIWLPLAHPVAPAPASAVLSGVMIKAGLLGWLLMLPLGEVSLPGLGGLIIALGILASFGGALVGVCQQTAKAVLAYSSVSQMGLMTLTIGLILMEASLAAVLMPIATLFALHHGLAKGALFLSVSVNGQGLFYRLATLLPALSLIGLPFTSGAAVKLALKAALPDPEVNTLVSTGLPIVLSIAAVGTSLLMARFFWCLRRQSDSLSADRGQVGWWLLVVFFSLGLFWWLPNTLAETLRTGAAIEEAKDLLFPLLIAGILLVISRLITLPLPRIPAGDILIPISMFLGWSYRNLSLQGEAIGRQVSAWAVTALTTCRRQLLERSSPEGLEIALRRHGVWVFLLVTGALVLLMQTSH